MIEVLAKQQKYYGQNTRLQEMAPDDQVLVLLQSLENKLLAKCQFLYIAILKKITHGTYLFANPKHGKTEQIFHVNP